MRPPIVAIVGRPNVGKSSLLNCLAGRRIAIVHAQPGVTRDRVSAVCALGGGHVELVDSGGVGVEDAEGLTRQVEEQIARAVADADVVIFLVDARDGVMPLDRLVARRLRRADKPVVLAANKVDHPNLATESGELTVLGFGEPVRISARHGLGIGELTEAVSAALGGLPAPPPRQAVMKLAVVGKRNVGKSSFINALAGQQRVIVSERPGTTRDSVDVTVELDGRAFTLIDTAGVRKRRRIREDLDFYSHHRALRSIRRADVVALMIDASVPVGKVDKLLGAAAVEEFKPVVLVVNKWDLARQRASGADYRDYLEKVFPFLTYAPLSLTSAAEGLNVGQTVLLAEELFAQANTRVSTGDLNRAMKAIAAVRGPSAKRGARQPKVYYASQTAVAPPTIVCFVNDPASFTGDWERFLVNQLRSRLPFAEVPIRLLLRPRRREDTAGTQSPRAGRR